MAVRSQVNSAFRWLKQRVSDLDARRLSILCAVGTVAVTTCVVLIAVQTILSLNLFSRIFSLESLLTIAVLGLCYLLIRLGGLTLQIMKMAELEERGVHETIGRELSKIETVLSELTLLNAELDTILIDRFAQLNDRGIQSLTYSKRLLDALKDRLDIAAKLMAHPGNEPALEKLLSSDFEFPQTSLHVVVGSEIIPNLPPKDLKSTVEHLKIVLREEIRFNRISLKK